MKAKKTVFKLGILFFSLLLLLGLEGCKRSDLAVVEITVSSEIKEKIEKVTPKSKYPFYVLKTVHLDEVKDLTEMTLLTCGDIYSVTVGALGIPTQLMKITDLLNSSIDNLGVPLFKAAKAYFIAENVESKTENPQLHLNQPLSLIMDV